jgi:hypothetical protein
LYLLESKIEILASFGCPGCGGQDARIEKYLFVGKI